ncbi:MAG TPA: transcriptional regulator NrdR [Candidatus Saccharimonadales bacterium]|nr:transcriptional regulator NrdR [Candidatus Saccharimonadales bacterium]
MRCPYCKNENTDVTDSREVMGGEVTRRRRECNDCRKRFTTYERIETEPITVIKRNNTRQQFDRSKVLNGIMKACEKREISRAVMEEITDRIETRIRSKGGLEITSKEIGNMVVKELFKLDPVAYIRFASVYNNFGSPEEFRKAISVFGSRKRGRNIKKTSKGH